MKFEHNNLYLPLPENLKKKASDMYFGSGQCSSVNIYGLIKVKSDTEKISCGHVGKCNVGCTLA